MKIQNTISIFLASVFFQHTALGLIIPIIFIWQRSQGLSFAEIGLIQAIGLLTLVLSELPSSLLADKYGRKRTIILGLLSILLSFVALYSAKAFIGFLIVDVLQKLGLSLLSGTEEGFMHDLTGDKTNNSLTKDLGRMSIADEVGTLVGMGLMSTILLVTTPSIGFSAGGLFVLVALILILLVKPENNIMPHAENTMNTGLSMWKRYIPILILIFIINAFISERGEMIFQAQFQNTGLVLSSFGFIYMFAKLFSILGSWLAHSIEQVCGTKNTISTSIFIQIISLSLLFSQSIVFVMLALCIFFFSENIFRNVRSSFVLKIVPSHLKATSLSVVSFSSAIVLSALQPIIGYSADISLSAAIVILVIIKFIALIVLGLSTMFKLHS